MATAKVIVIAFVAYSTLHGHGYELLNLSRTDLSAAVATVWGIATDVGVRVGLVMLVIAAGDYVFQKRQLEKTLRMSRQELIEELKRYENPFIRARIRQQQRRIAMRRMMSEVPQADVVITNPTRIAVAIKYEPGSMEAPQVIAKGQRLMAQRIRRLAAENDVPIVERKPLAQALYKMVEVGMEIPAQLYQAVAEVLAFIYGLKGERR